MLALLDNGQDLAECERELGTPVGQLLTPLTRYRLREPNRKWAIDNGGFKKLDSQGHRTLLAREEARKADCLFVAVPDIIGSARRTLEVFERWAPQLTGWKLALVCQDGQEDLPIPWDAIDAVFIGGSTEWKCGPHAEAIVRTGKALEKWVHVGRVNDPTRFKHFENLGADSCDGSGMARYTHMRERIAARHTMEETLV